MSGRGRGRGRGRGPMVAEPPVVQDVPSPEFNQDSFQEKPKRVKVQSKSVDDYRRITDIIKSRISVIIDSLEGDDPEPVLKKNVSTAVKHLKQIESLLDA